MGKRIGEKPDFHEITTDAWGQQRPDWIVVLANNANDSSLGKVAEKIGYSAATLSQAMRNSYAGNVDRLAKTVLSKLTDATVNCPVQGNGLQLSHCLENLRHVANGNRSGLVRVKLAKACPACPHNHGGNNG
ncbi:MAG: hypothetical protein ACPGOV_11715 [Magnetovibrionaceae bacterium]